MTKYLTKNGERREIIDTTKDGKVVFYRDNGRDNWGILLTLLIDGWTIEEEPEKWVPKQDESYWIVMVGVNYKVVWRFWSDTKEEKKHLALNLVFRTEEEALARYEEIVSLIR